MISVTTNIGQQVKGLVTKLNPNNLRDKVLRAVANSVFADMKVRIHRDGKDSSGNQIGIYTPEYMKVRTGQFATNEVYKRGAKKGQLKPIGVYTKGKNKGQPREKYNRTNDTKVVISLTRQMENDFAVIHSGKDYGLGYKNSLNRDKVDWVEATYKKDIFKMTEAEKEKAITVATEEIKRLLR